MLLLELKKIKRKKLPLIFAIIVIVGTTIQYFMGNMTYNGVAYGNKLGWFFKNGLTLNSYYLFIPVISLVGMELFVLEGRNNTLKNLLVIPINKKEIMLNKIYFLFIFTTIYMVITFLSMCLLESMFNANIMSSLFVLSYFLKYLIHGIVCYILSVFIIMTMLYFKQSIQITVAVAFVFSFIGVFISQVKIAYVYCVNAMFYISGEVDSNMFEKTIAGLAILFLAFLDIKLLAKISHREAL
ncbi:MAG: ABC transporter permease [Treponemataceae bacterium]